MTDAKRELEKLIEESDLYCPSLDINSKKELVRVILEKFVHKDEILEHVEIDEEKVWKLMPREWTKWKYEAVADIIKDGKPVRVK